jgi:phosphoglucosamine mutase
MARLFGTDGVRGRANADLTPELAMRIAVAAAHTLAERDRSHPPVAVVGRDPRASGEMLEAAVVAGLASTGAIVIRVGVLPTPGVAYLIGETKADFGVMVSASHNPMPDNGIKLFAAGGQKLPDDIEDAIEAELATPTSWTRPTGIGIGRVHDLLDGADSYVNHLVESAPNRFDGLKVVVDCANGAASEIAPAVYGELGAEVIAIHAEPDGSNINVDCGATDLTRLRQLVTDRSLDLGVAFDGDGDRMLAVDERGEAVDGDQIIAVLALHLGVELVAVTVMTNLGFHRLMAERGVRVVTTPVGDRYVLEALRREDAQLGGEQSGHVIWLRDHVTGDGLAAALLLCGAIRGGRLSEAAAVMPRFPQVLRNVRVPARELPQAVADEVDRVNAELGESGRVLVRRSGTEPMFRVLVEAETAGDAEKLCASIAALVQAELG